jgi:hypothetical protein
MVFISITSLFQVPRLPEQAWRPRVLSVIAGLQAGKAGDGQGRHDDKAQPYPQLPVGIVQHRQQAVIHPQNQREQGREFEQRGGCRQGE